MSPLSALWLWVLMLLNLVGGRALLPLSVLAVTWHWPVTRPSQWDSHCLRSPQFNTAFLAWLQTC